MLLMTQQNDSHILLTGAQTIAKYDITCNVDSSVQLPQASNDMIINLTVSKDKKLIAVATENKRLIIYDSELRLVNSFQTCRTASCLVFTPLLNDIVVADKTGDVYRFQLNGGNNTKADLLLGHPSMILDMAFSDCGKFIITCDRDEKIRISHFPNCYNIVSFCLGHKEFVTKIQVVKKDFVISASGDGTVRFWRFLEGHQLGVINTNEFITNQKLIQDFANTMDTEKVDIYALPVTDLQILQNNDDYIIIAVTLHTYAGIQFYKTDLNRFVSTYLFSIEDFQRPFHFSLAKRLLVYNDNLLKCYQFENEQQFIEFHCSNLTNFYNKYKDSCKTVDRNGPISVLYKRKFDSVQEYYEKKKSRLEGD